jgi:energy-coupling factor transporter ATP-binding protein EcfA2
MDPIDEDRDDPGDIGQPDPSWADCPILPRSDILAVIERRKDLDGRTINLLRNALKGQPRSDLLEHYLGPHLYHPGSHYMYTTPDPDRIKFKNWRPEITAMAIEHRSIAPCAVFSNTLSWIDATDLSPSQRTYNAGFAVHTFEPDSDALDAQFRVIYSGKLKRIDADLRRYRDYRGYEVVYSGGKSLHFHFCFDLRHVKHDLAVGGNSSYRDNWTRDLPDNLLRPAYAVSWDRLAATFRDMTGLKPDPRLRSWEQLRRCPWALRLVKGGHPLGLPHGHLIPQPVLASAIFRNSKREATEWFHDPDKLGELCRHEHARRCKTFIKPEFDLTSRQMELFGQHAPAIFRQIIDNEYPKFAGFEVNEAGFRCRFYNGPSDNNPSSFCEGNRSRILLQGRHGLDFDGVALSTTPNQIFDWIVSQHSETQDQGDRAPDDCIMRRYKAAVDDRASLARFIDDNMVEMTAPPVTTVTPAWILKLFGGIGNPHTHVLIRGPQGCGKSTKVMVKIAAIHDNDPGVIFFSSPSIKQAEEKIESFERMNKDERFIPYLYLSLTALYERFCPSSDRLDHIEILEDSGSSWLHAVYERQRDVYDAMYAYRCELHDLRAEGKVPILFGTHETMRQHAGNGMTRLFYSSDFNDKWFEKMGLQERECWRNGLLAQNSFHRVIVDEVTAHDLVSIHQAQLVEWVQRCAAEIRLGSIFDIAERYTKFRAHLFEHPCKDMTWNLFLEVLKCEYTDEHIVEVSGQEVPFDDNDGIYAKMAGQRYYVRSRGWWNDFFWVTMLTTEAVPTRIIETIDRESASQGEEQDDRFKVYDFGLPDSSRDTVMMELQRACKKETLAEIVRAYHAQNPQAEVIADMVKDRISEFAVTTHISAKGSNAYINSDIIAFYNAPSPALFGELGALNTRFKRSDLVRLLYIDRFDQTCGRNRGFRGEGGREHRAVFPPRLHSWLAPAMSGASYVGVKTKPHVELSPQTDESNEPTELEN